jgi:hypothetical protein
MRRLAAILPACLGCAAPSWAAAPADDRCLAAYDAESTRIEREFAARPPAREPAAQQQWSRELHDALEGAARRARQCQEDSRPKPGSAEFQKEVDRLQPCLAQVDRRVAEFDRRYRGRTLSSAEQVARHEEEARIIDERMQCQRQVRR